MLLWGFHIVEFSLFTETADRFSIYYKLITMFGFWNILTLLLLSSYLLNYLFS